MFMAVIIKNRQLIEDHCQHLQLEDALPVGLCTVPLQRWLDERESLRFNATRIGVRLRGDDDIQALIPDLPRLQLIALEFPKFTDGRCYSHARLLRERYDYRGELRAIGEVLRDQLYFMLRCGIDAFELKPHQDAEAALQAFNEISIQYQSAADGHGPLYRHRRTAIKVSSLEVAI
jgi:uncharacterized protein (DUF934 family)